MTTVPYRPIGSESADLVERVTNSVERAPIGLRLSDASEPLIDLGKLDMLLETCR